MSHDGEMNRPMQKTFYALIVEPKHTKAVKMALESQDLLNKTMKIERREDGRLFIPLVIEASPESGRSTGGSFRERLEVEHLEVEPEINKSTLMYFQYEVTTVFQSYHDEEMILNPLQHALFDSADSLPSSSPAKTFFTANSHEMQQNCPKLYVVYQPMLLLPVNFPGQSKWLQFLDALRSNAGDEHHFYSSIARGMQVTHIAKNEPIAAKILDCSESVVDNSIRSPGNIQPLFGYFGPQIPPFPGHIPSEQDYEDAFWVLTCQNGITQVWAPRYTMFSAGNVTEKARILDLPSVRGAVRHGCSDGKGSTAVDLFSGIGYFAFSYAKAGVSKVLCWDLNPWSIEGLKRGARANKWSCHQLVDVMKPGRTTEDIITSLSNAARSDVTFVLFCETNELARDRISPVQDQLPPIRHVNCGMLPTTGEAWKTAIDIIDPDVGGWIHLHESLHAKDASSLAEPYVKLFQDYFNTIVMPGITPLQIKLDGTFRVKSMGPRLWHHVFDFWIPPRHG